MNFRLISGERKIDVFISARPKNELEPIDEKSTANNRGLTSPYSFNVAYKNDFSYTVVSLWSDVLLAAYWSAPSSRFTSSSCRRRPEAYSVRCESLVSCALTRQLVERKAVI